MMIRGRAGLIRKGVERIYGSLIIRIYSRILDDKNKSINKLIEIYYMI